MKKLEIHKLDLDNIFEVQNFISFRKIQNKNKNNFRGNRQNFKKSKSFKSFGNNNINNENEKNQNEELTNIFNKTYNNKPMFLRKKTKQVSFKLNNIIDEIKKKEYNDKENKNELKNIIRNFSSNTKESTKYKIRKKGFISSKQLKYNFNNISNVTNNRRKINSERQSIRSFSADKLSKNINNNINKINDNNILSGSQFITALSPISNHRTLNKDIENKSGESFFYNKIKAEKKFLTYFDIKKIYFLDKKVYKPNKKFEKQVNKLKKNNSNEFIMNFNLNTYKIKVLNLFQKNVCHQNFNIMKKNFDLLTKAWKWKDNLKCHSRIKRAISTTQTEREIRYNQHKIDRENRIKNRNTKKNKDKKPKEN